ncbi:MAG: DUF488 domain-containing protein [Betaproteobacteria bacterium]|nr:DUF488 domain-containing protein [Betaproteobacteria bacterium]MDE2622761.1 DUF488 domain-containing protein [Betaproteobacteria bacterium]
MIKPDRIRIKRAYDPPDPADGIRLLVDRLWPRGLRKEAAALDDWQKDLAPSPGLRQWFGHDPARWQEFRQRYLAEMAANPEPFESIRTLARSGTVTLLYAARDAAHNHALVLRDFLLGRFN